MFLNDRKRDKVINIFAFLSLLTGDLLVTVKETSEKKIDKYC